MGFSINCTFFARMQSNTNCRDKMAHMLYAILFALLISGILARPGIDGRIVGGYAAREGQFPYAAAVYINFGTPNQYSFCGGALISPLFVITAAHCLIETTEALVVLGNAFLNESSIYEARARVSSINFIIPDDYVQGVFDWDLGLIRLPEPIESNINLQAIRLAEGTYTFAGEMGVVVGWGATYQAQNTIEQTLRYAENVILSNAECIREYGPSYQDIIHDNHVCQSAVGSRGACHGDSGAPLVVEGELVGLVSFGPNNCFREFPVVFSRITSLREWIRENAGV